MLGNDIVDLGDPETFVAARHPRFDARVFSAAERAAIESSATPNELRWSFWAAKESAYKLMRKSACKLIFAPQKFCVKFDVYATQSQAGLGRVRIDGETLPVRIVRVVPRAGEASGVALHAVCTLPGQAADSWCAGVAEIETLRSVSEPSLLPSAAVRRLALQAVAHAFRLDVTRLCIERDADRIPYFTFRDARLAVSLSLAHHGRFVAFSCTSPSMALESGRAA